MDKSFILGVAIAAGVALIVSQQTWLGIFVVAVCWAAVIDWYQ